MFSEGRLERLHKLRQADIEALPDRPVLPEANAKPQSKHENSGGVSLEPLLPIVDAPSTQSPVESIDSHPRKEAQPAPDQSPERRFVLVQSAQSSYKPKLDAVLMSSRPPEAATPLPDTQLQRGDLASIHHHFTPIQALAKYPYKFCNKNHMQDIATAFFDQGKFWERVWDLYYIWDIEPSATKPIVLVRENQSEALLKEINNRLGLRLCITNDQREDGLVASFPNHPRCLPRYLGRSHSRQEYDIMVENTPSDTFRVANEPAHPPLNGQTLEDFKQLMEELWDVQKAKTKASKVKKQQDRLVKQKTMADQFKRAQRYLGLRPSASSGMAQSGAVKAIDPSVSAPFAFDQSVVFICIDVESYERDHNKITEVGVATLDTRDLIGIAPGVDGVHWRQMIRARHFRIKEYRHLVNTQFVAGHPDKFDFGQSTLVGLNDVANHVAACFRAPFGRLHADGAEEIGTRTSKADVGGKRSIIFLGHDTLSDIRYLQQLGYDPIKAENIIEALDTAVLYRVWRREQQATNLGKILWSFDIAGFHLHNAGNDAVFTIQAMLAICVREATIRGSSELHSMRVQDKATRLTSSIEEAQQRANDEAEGWSDNEVEGDGGPPVPLASHRTTQAFPVQTSSYNMSHSPISMGPRGGGHGRGRGRGQGGTSRQHLEPDEFSHMRRRRGSDEYRGGLGRGAYRNSGRGQVEGRGRG